MKRLLPLIPLLFTIGCTEANYYRKPTTAESRSLIWEEDLTLSQQTYLMKLRSEPTEFEMQADASNEAWKRATRFVQEYSGMKIRAANQAEIRTFMAIAPAGYVGDSCEAGYFITRQKTPDGGYRFVIKTAVSAPEWVPCEIGRLRNARILSNYVRTGKLPHPELIQK
jgi:hypothetical protein